MIREKWRKLIKHQYDFEPITPVSQNLKLVPSITLKNEWFKGDKKFTFLNLEKDFNGKIDWNFSDYGKLWTYNLSYFEFLHQDGLKKEEGIALIKNFIKNKNGLKDALEPFPISLRSIFWIKFFIKYDIKNKGFDQFLYAQLQILLNHCEYHLMGNHLLENGFALLFGAYYFNDSTLYKKAEQILINELEEQILADGAHFELSPMYHQLMLYRVLDCYNLANNNKKSFNLGLATLLKSKATKMLGWLQAISWKKGTIPLLNDSTNDIAPTTNELIEYANRLGIKATSAALRESGYRKLTDSQLELIADIGQIGPSYIPGHAHSDSLNFVLSVNGLDIIVDTGISTYEKNGVRQLERSTAAHNTVQIGALEQSAIWGGFRVGKRANTTILKEEEGLLEVEHDGYKNIGVYHRRLFKIETKKIVIEDKVSSNLTTTARFHFHPDIDIQKIKNGLRVNTTKFLWEGEKTIKLGTYQYAIGFNKREKATVAEVIFTNSLKTIITHENIILN